MPTATGHFDVRLTPARDEPFDGGRLGRMTLDKTFHGELAGSSAGEMLTVMTPVAGSAVYVAVEHVSGALHGRTGSFALRHVGHMRGGRQDLSIVVVPDSGAGQLAGIEGELHLRIDGGVHYYTLDYTLVGQGT